MKKMEENENNFQVLSCLAESVGWASVSGLWLCKDSSLSPTLSPTFLLYWQSPENIWASTHTDPAVMQLQQQDIIQEENIIKED